MKNVNLVKNGLVKFLPWWLLSKNEYNVDFCPSVVIQNLRKLK